MKKEDLHILAVDDDMINLKLLKSMLLKTGQVTKVTEAKNGEIAIEILKNDQSVDLVLLDIIMPIMGGIDVLKVARADSRLNQVPIIVLTTDETKKGEAMEVGANDFLMKPIRKDDLLVKINNILV